MRKTKRGDLFMMPGIVMQNAFDYGNYYVTKEKQEKKETKNGLFSNIKFYCKFIALQQRLKKLDYRNIIEKNTDILNGKAVIKGTRIMPKVVLDYFVEDCKDKTYEEEQFVEKIKKEYPSLKNKNNQTIIKILLYAVAYESITNLIKY